MRTEPVRIARLQTEMSAILRARRILAVAALACLPHAAASLSAKERFPREDAIPLPPKRPVFAPAPEQNEQPPAMESGGEAAVCSASLAAAGVVLHPAPIAPQSDPGCGMAEPVALHALTMPDGARIELPDRPTLDCAAAATFADFVKEALAPLVEGDFNVAIAAISTGPGFDCRTRDHLAGAKLSAHARGLAIDVASIKFADGRLYRIGEALDDKGRAFDRAARAAACGYFHTALGPGADSFHQSHWHFDLEPRGRDGQSKFCQ
jgi:hypothetical protein